MAKKKIKKEKVSEIFKIEKDGEEKFVEVKNEIKKEEKTTKKQIEKENKQLKNIFIGIGVFLLIIVAFVIASKIITTYNYNGIKFEKTKIGEGGNYLYFYETKTLLETNDETKDLFGFRIRTNPNELKDIPFEDLENFQLTNLNAYAYGNGTFNCEGDGIIAMPNFIRVFEKIGSQIVWDQNATCDEEGRYTFFLFNYGDKTEIKKIGNRCYEVVIKGDDNKCEILPATEKIMVEVFIKYRDL